MHNLHEIKNEIFSAGYDININGIYCDILKNGKLIFKDYFSSDLRDVLDMFENENDLTLEIMLLNSQYDAINTTDFYNWLLKNKKQDFHRINDVQEYLINRFSFVKGSQFIQGNVISILKTIGQYYFEREIVEKGWLNVNGFKFNYIRDLISKPLHFSVNELNDTHEKLIKDKEYIAASRINHLIQSF